MGTWLGTDKISPLLQLKLIVRLCSLIENDVRLSRCHWLPKLTMVVHIYILWIRLSILFATITTQYGYSYYHQRAQHTANTNGNTNSNSISICCA